MTEVTRFRALGCEVAVCGADREAVAQILDRYDVVFSRFRPDSELVAVNADPRPALLVSPLFADVLRTALDLVALTDGLVDPTLGTAIEAAGYDRDFADVGDEGPVGPAVSGRPGSVLLDGLLLRRPPGLLLDLNGVAKAAAVDEAGALIVDEGFVAVGGDLVARGAVDVGLPAGGAIRVLSGGLATSGTTGRRWRRGGEEQHHLIDPATGRPASSCWREVTVAGATCVDADVAAKAAFLLDADGPEWLDERGLPGRFVGHYDEILENAVWSRAQSPQPACI